ncbi:hypothetical protein ACIQOV_11045 [Kitasatospora sp. NPDC091257]|uniref:hypothetical protein n=1 Tax=Kitasatospora sp. NPDC091257 TaxID=3364084 RepID=UPI00380A2806
MAGARGGTLLCVVRGSSAEEARARLDAAFDSGDPELMARYRESAAPGISRWSPATSGNRVSDSTRRPGSGWPTPWT